MSPGTINPGHIVKTKVVYTDLRGEKIRPALVICSSEYADHRPDLIVLPITSKPDAEKHGGVVLDPSDPSFALTGLSKRSVIQSQKPLTIHKSLCSDVLGTVPEELYDRAMGELRSYLQFDL